MSQRCRWWRTFDQERGRWSEWQTPPSNISSIACSRWSGHDGDHRPPVDEELVAQVGRWSAFRVTRCEGDEVAISMTLTPGRTAMFDHRLEARSDAELDELRVLLDQVSLARRPEPRVLDGQDLRDHWRWIRQEIVDAAAQVALVPYRHAQVRAYVEVRLHPRAIHLMVNERDRTTFPDGSRHPILELSVDHPWVCIREFHSEEMKRG